MLCASERARGTKYRVQLGTHNEVSGRNRLYTLVVYEFLVSKETVVLRRWERSKQKFGFIKRVDKG